MVPQDEIRRRIRAAMALAGITSWEDLATRTPFSRSLLKDLGTERAVAGEHHLRAIAAACSVPYAWFTVPGLSAALEGADDATLEERVEALERKVESLRQTGGDERRQPPGVLGRDARGSTTSSPHPAQVGSGQEEGSQPGTGEA